MGITGREGYFTHQNPADEQIHHCTPQNVAQKGAASWLLAALRETLASGQPYPIVWGLGQQRFQANLFDHITQIVECQETGHDVPDIALLDSSGVTRCILALNLSGQPDQASLDRLFAAGIPTLLLPPDLFTGGQASLPDLLAHAKVRGPWWLDTSPLPQGLETRPVALRIALLDMVSGLPYFHFRPLITAGACRDVLLMNGRLLWLAPALWKAAAGEGRSVNNLGDLSIEIAEWPQRDGSIITAFYVTRLHDPATASDDERAIGLRRRWPDQPDFPGDIRRTSLPYRAFRPDVTALDIASLLVSTGA